MIKSNELRIYNWVALGEHGDVQVVKITEGTTSFDPIPITPEILNQLGEPKGDGWIYLPNNFRVCCADVTGLCNLSKGMMETGNDEIDWYIIACPEYLHTLQNIIHSLTGEELEVKLG